MSVEFLRDDFIRGDSVTVGTPVLGPAWAEVEPNGTASISANRLLLNMSGSSQRAGVFANAGLTNHGIFMTVATFGGAHPWIGVRLPFPGVLPGQNLVNANPGEGFYLQINDSGGVSMLKSLSTTSSTTPIGASTTSANFFNVAVGDEVGLVVVGPLGRVLHNGRVVAYWNDTAWSGNTGIGIWASVANNPGSFAVSKVRATRSQASYPTPMMPKMAYDRDGSVGVASGVAVPTAAELISLNDANPAPAVGRYNQNSGFSYGVKFPEPRTILGIFSDADYGFAGGLIYSTSPNGTDTPTSLTGATSATIPTSMQSPGYRFPNWIGLLTGVTSIMLSTSWGQNPTLRTLHIYGYPTSNSNVHRVAFWHPFWDMRLPGDYLDFDDVLRGGTYYREFRIKNTSTVYTTNNVVLDIESLEYGTTVTDEYSIKRASEGTYGPNTTIPTLAPGALSEIISVRRIVGGAAPFRLDAPRIRSQIGSLT